MGNRGFRSFLAAALLAFAWLCSAAIPLEKTPITLDGAEMARLVAAISLPRPGVLVTVTGVYVYDLGRTSSAPHANFETDAFETGPGYRRHRLGWCELAQGAKWNCTNRDRLTRTIRDFTITATLPIDMSTELAIRALDFAVPLVNEGLRPEIEFSLKEYEDYISVGFGFGSGCITFMDIRIKGEAFEKVDRKTTARICY